MSAHPNIKKLLAEARKQASVSTGAKTVAAAIAASTKLTATEAAKVMDLPLSDPKIGISDKAAMRALKKNLAFLAPGAAAEIARIPEQSGLTPRDLAEYVSAISKQSAAAQPLRAAPAVFVKSATAEARKKCGDQYGRDFGEKASDRLVQALDIRMHAGMRETAMGAAQSLVLEMHSEDVGEQAMAESTAGAAREAVAPPSRGHRTAAMRESFYSSISTMRADLERKLSARAGFVRESAVDLGSATDVCWLNGTMRALGAPKTIADVAADPKVRRIGIPRALAREINVTAKTMGAIAFRLSHNLSGKDILIAVIDGEVDAKHPGLTGRVLQKRNFTKESWGHPDPHGTGVAGIIASADKRFTGLAPGARIASYKVFATDATAQGSDFDATLAIQQAVEDGVAIANCSWGVGLATDGTSREARAFDRAWDLGLILVKSAGNGGPGAGTMTSPADARGVIVAAATDRKQKQVQSYSSRGPLAHKPGPDLAVPGGAQGADEIHSLLVGGGTGSIGVGTSFAAPHVVGAIALLLEQSPHLTPDQIKAALLKKCVALNGAAASDCGSGVLVF